MNFKNLNKDVKQGIKALTIDAEFQNRFATDKILDELDAQKFNRAQELRLLTLLFQQKITLCDVEVNAITPKIWSFIWILDTGFTNAKKEISQIDIDMIMYVLQNPIESFDLTKILSFSVGYCKKNQIYYDTAINIIAQSIRLSFKPLNMFPKSNIVGNQIMYYDVDWLTSTVAKVHAVTGLKPTKIMNMSLTAVCYYFAQYARINGAQNIYRRSPEEILIAQDQRCCELIVQRLIENGVITEEQRESIYKIISNSEQS